jgi:hypothetical protein
MPDEVIADLSRYGGGAQALPLFSFSARVLQPDGFQCCGFILRDASLRDAPPAITAEPLRRDEGLEILMVRSIARRCVSNHGARDTDQQEVA